MPSFLFRLKAVALFTLAGSLGVARLASAQVLPPPAPPPAAKSTPRQPSAAKTPAKAPASKTPASKTPAPAVDPATDEPLVIAPDVNEPGVSEPGTSEPGAGPLPEGGELPSNPPVAPPIVPQPAPKVQGKAKVGGIAVPAGSDAVAVRTLRRLLAYKLQMPVTLSDGAQTYVLRRGELGASIPLAALISQARRTRRDVQVRFVVDEAQARRAVRLLARRINRKAQPVSLDAQNGRAVLSGGDGVEVAVVGSVQRIRQALEAQPPRSRLDLVVARTTWNGGASEATLRAFRYVLAVFSTPYDASIQGRTTNLRMAAQLVNGTIVAPGAVFSANQAIGPRKAEAGWREAKMFVNGQIVSGVGSGICQCSSTIYNAALLAGLPIIERHPHSFRVVYAPPSRDAAIYWGQKDFRFRNSTAGPIYVQTFLSGNRFYVRLYGTQAASGQVDIESRTISRRNGTLSEAYRIVRDPAGVRRERLSRDYYKPHP